MPGAYYNEHDRDKAAWLRELIREELIADGEVDECSIVDVRAGDLRGFTQCHFFGGIGVWSYAFRLAGRSDSESIWTGSCPCPPFSQAGKKKRCPECASPNLVPHVGRTGFFVCCICGHEWLADARHLWPEMWRLIRDGRPAAFLGEQVASPDGLAWLALVRASLEILGYAVRGTDLPAASVGAPHIRQRLWFMANAADDGRHARAIDQAQQESGPAFFDDGSATGGMGVADRAGWEPGLAASETMGYGHSAVAASGNGRLADAASGGCEHEPNHKSSRILAQPPQDARGWAELGRHSSSTGGGLADANGGHSGAEGLQRGGEHRQQPQDGGAAGGLVNPAGEQVGVPGRARQQGISFWSDAEWIACTDGKARPTQPRPQQMAHGIAEGMVRGGDAGRRTIEEEAAETHPLISGARARTMRLRGYGDAVNAYAAAEFIKAACPYEI